MVEVRKPGGKIACGGRPWDLLPLWSIASVLRAQDEGKKEGEGKER